MARFVPTLLVVLLASPASYAAAPAPPSPPSILQAAVHNGRLWTADRVDGSVAIRVRPFDGVSPEVVWEYVIRANVQSPRWHIANGSLWLDSIQSEYDPPVLHACHEYFHRMDTRELYSRKGPARIKEADGSMAFAQPHMDYTFGNPCLPNRWRWASNFCAFPPAIYSDYLSAEPGHVRNFLLTNVRNAVRSVHRGKGVALIGTRVGLSDEESAKPIWNMTVRSCKAKWDAKAKVWDDGGKWWPREQSLEVSFREPFRVFGKGNDYFFLTDSGSLYWAPPSMKEGWTRRVTRVYDGRKRRVVAVITDADAKRTILFVDAERNGKPAFFELAAKPALRSFDEGDLPKLDANDPMREVLRYTRLLEGLKLLKQTKP